eukprot:SAG11_NODE_1976_length_3974_cov_4.102452_4_plen_138_part_00
MQWENVNGMAVPKFPRLPDEFTDVDVAGMYAEAVRVGVSDMASASEMGSRPDGESLNDFCSEDIYTRYITIWMAITAMAVGGAAWRADFEDAYFQLPLSLRSPVVTWLVSNGEGIRMVFVGVLSVLDRSRGCSRRLQ